MTQRILRGSRLLTAVLLALGATACLAPPPPATEVPPTPLSAAVPAAQPVAGPAEVRADSPERAARELTLRIRASGCGNVATGSGFAISDRTLVTNRHVIANASEIQVNTWDGRSLRATLARVAPESDLALLAVDGELPQVGALAARDAAAGDEAMVVGFPLGGRQAVAAGTVLDYVIGANLGDNTEVMRLSVDVEPGNSGGPVLGEGGDVTGVVYAIELATSQALAIPASSVRSLLHDDSGPPPAPAC